MFNVYKEIDPIETIMLARNALTELGVNVREKLWFHPYVNVFSCALEVIQTDIMSFGKGVTAEYCLASAYGELIEEINSGLAFQGIPFSDQTKQDFGFLYDPKEVVLHDVGKYNLPCEFEESFPFRDGTSTAQFFSDQVKSTLRNGLTVVPFEDMLTDRKCYLPISIVSLINGSNGICAGNSKEEALIHGLCEILERYSIKQHFIKKLSAPEYSKKSIEKQAPQVYQMIQEIEKEDIYRIIIKDCSLGGKFPVVAILLIDRRCNRYAVNFGSDPDLSVALHRCITEIYQGGEIPEHKLIDINFVTGEVDVEECNKFIRSGRGKWPYSFFLDAGEVPFCVKEYSSMNEKEEDILNTLKRNGAKGIWIRDCSYIALNSFQIIVPGFSEALSLPNDYQYIRSFDEPIYYLTKLSELNMEELKKFAKSLEWHIMYRFSGNRKFIQDYLNIQFDDDMWDSITIEGLLFIIYLKIGDLNNSVLWLQKYISILEQYERDETLDFFHCLFDAYRLLDNYKDSIQVQRILSIYYGAEIIKDTMCVINNPSTLFDSLRSLPCFRCDLCENEKSCNYKYKEILYKKVKKKKGEANV